MLVEDKQLSIRRLSAFHFIGLCCQVLRLRGLTRIFDFVYTNDQILYLFFVSQAHLLQLATFLLQCCVLACDLLIFFTKPRHGFAFSMLDGNGLD